VLLEWTEKELVINVNFSNPETISDVKFDKFKINLMNTQLFVSKESGLVLKEENCESHVDIPKQLPKGVTEISIKEKGKKAKIVMTTFLVL